MISRDLETQSPVSGSGSSIEDAIAKSSEERLAILPLVEHTSTGQGSAAVLEEHCRCS
jgi:hypothetical protein